MTPLRVVKPRTLADLKRLIIKGATLTVVKSNTLPPGLVRTVTRPTGRGYYFSWSHPSAPPGHPARFDYATWPYARDVEVLSDHAYTVRRNGAEITWSIKAPS